MRCMDGWLLAPTDWWYDCHFISILQEYYLVHLQIFLIQSKNAAGHDTGQGRILLLQVLYQLPGIQVAVETQCFICLADNLSALGKV